MKLKSMLIVAAKLVVLAVASGVAISAQDKYTLKLPDGVAFADFKGYEDWQLISTSKTDDRMKVILGNPTILPLSSPVFRATASHSQKAPRSQRCSGNQRRALKRRLS